MTSDLACLRAVGSACSSRRTRCCVGRRRICHRRTCREKALPAREITPPTGLPSRCRVGYFSSLASPTTLALALALALARSYGVVSAKGGCEPKARIVDQLILAGATTNRAILARSVAGRAFQGPSRPWKPYPPIVRQRTALCSSALAGRKRRIARHTGTHSLSLYTLRFALAVPAGVLCLVNGADRYPLKVVSEERDSAADRSNSLNSADGSASDTSRTGSNSGARSHFACQIRLSHNALGEQTPANSQSRCTDRSSRQPEASTPR